MKRLLCIVSAMNAGGAETFLMKIYRAIDRSRFQMDFCVNTDTNLYSDEIHSLGGKIYVIPLKSKHPIQSFRCLKTVVKNNHYDYVIRVNEHSLSTIDLIAARCGGAKHIAMRSSNASSGSAFSVFLHKAFRFLPILIPNIRIAPSVLAAEYTFGRNAVEHTEVCILPNGLNIDQFRYRQEIREKYREKYGLHGKMVIGHVGRFSEQKNHTFLLQVFKEIKKRRDNAVLLLIGDGPLKATVLEKAQSDGTTEDMIYTGVIKNVNEMLSAMDIFVFPSLYEGMPNTVIEAQTSGLPCLISDAITEEAKVTDLVQMMSLNVPPSQWAEAAIVLYDKYREMEREQYGDIMKTKGYDINDCGGKFCEIIFGD